MRKFFSEFLLLVVVIIWGLAFVWQSEASKFLGALNVVGFRSLIASIFLIIVATFSKTLYQSQEPKFKTTSSTKKNILYSSVCGVILFLGMYIQQIGLALSTASKSGFITVLYICVVPLIGLFLGYKVNKFFVIGLIMSIIGFYLLSVKGEFSLEYGDLLVLISAVFFGLHIIVIGRVALNINTMFLSIIQLLVVTILSLLLAFIKEGFYIENILNTLPQLLALGILSSGVGFTLQIIAQRNVSANTTSLILSLEAVVAAIGGVVILKEVLSTREVLGMIIVLAGVIISQKKIKKDEVS